MSMNGMKCGEWEGYREQGCHNKVSNQLLKIYFLINVDSMSLSHLNACNVHIEIQWFICQFDKMKYIIVGNIYWPPHGDPNIFIERLDDNLNNIRTMGTFERCILGDIYSIYIYLWLYILMSMHSAVHIMMYISPLHLQDKTQKY